MAQQFSIRLSGGSVGRPLDGVVRLVTVALGLALAMTLVGSLAAVRPPPSTAFLPTVAESTRSQPSVAGLDHSALNSDAVAVEASDDDGYLEGLAKALDHGL